MTILYVIGVILLIGFLFVGWSIFGWILNIIGAILEFLMQGAQSGCGCILYIIIGFFVIGAILALFGII